MLVYLNLRQFRSLRYRELPVYRYYRTDICRGLSFRHDRRDHHLRTSQVLVIFLTFCGEIHKYIEITAEIYY